LVLGTAQIGGSFPPSLSHNLSNGASHARAFNEQGPKSQGSFAKNSSTAVNWHNADTSPVLITPRRVSMRFVIYRFTLYSDTRSMAHLNRQVGFYVRHFLILAFVGISSLDKGGHDNINRGLRDQQARCYGVDYG
jgi:hypothetical protein